MYHENKILSEPVMKCITIESFGRRITDNGVAVIILLIPTTSRVSS